MLIGCHTICWGGVVGTAGGVTSVKDLYYRTDGSVEQAVRDIAASGYTGVEVFDGDILAVPDGLNWWARLLDDVGIELTAVYCGANFIYPDLLDDELFRIAGAAKAAGRLGARQLVIGGGARRATATTEADYVRLASALDRVVDVAEEYSLQASYHPHLGTMAESPHEIDQVMSRSRIAFCPDTAHLAAGGGDPAALIRRYGDRLAHVHMKDLAPDRCSFLPLGHGFLDFAAVLDALDEIGYVGWSIVELDTYDGDPGEAARQSRMFLDSVLERSSADKRSGKASSSC